MSNEMLPGKLSVNRTVDAESPIVVEKKKEKKKRQGSLLLFLIAVGLGAVAASSITLVPPATFHGYVGSPGSIDHGTGGDSSVTPTALAASATATDGEGTMIEDNGLTRSAVMTITGYSDTIYSPELSCSIDSLPVYCSGSPVTIPGLPLGEHVFTVMGSLGDKTAVQSFSWVISE
jgi:hypothetical protein